MGLNRKQLNWLTEQETQFRARFVPSDLDSPERWNEMVAECDRIYAMSKKNAAVREWLVAILQDYQKKWFITHGNG